MKRSICYIILISLVLHGASRMGLLSYLYQQRHNIAFHIGLIAEIPIALCNSQYSFSKELRIQEHHEDEKLPASFDRVTEIMLFFHHPSLQIATIFNALDVISRTILLTPHYASPALSIFRPPCLA